MKKIVLKVIKSNIDVESGEYIVNCETIDNNEEISFYFDKPLKTNTVVRVSTNFLLDDELEILGEL